MHDSFDYRVGRTRVVTNPRGYPLGNVIVKRVEDLAFENRTSIRCCCSTGRLVGMIRSADDDFCPFTGSDRTLTIGA